MRLCVGVLLVVSATAMAAPPKKAPKNQAAEMAARGDAWAVANRCDEAVKAYRQALTLQPKNAIVQVRMAHCLAKTGGGAEAKQILTTLADESGATGVAAYTIVPSELRADADAARAKLKAAGVNGAVMMRVVGKDQEIYYTPGMATPAGYGGFGPYWGYGWNSVYSPGYLSTDTIISVETLVYSLTDDKLLWASTSRTTNPGNLDQLIREVADATANEMAKQGLLAK